MTQWRELNLTELNEFLRDRGIEILEVWHPEEEANEYVASNTYKVRKFIQNLHKSSVEALINSGEESTIECGYFTIYRLFEQRGVTYGKLSNPFYRRFTKPVLEFTLKLRYKIKYKGKYIRKNPENSQVESIKALSFARGMKLHG